MKEQEIAKQLKTGKITVEESANLRIILAGIYAGYTFQLEEVLVNKSEVWEEIRKTTTSDKHADIKWEVTKEGKNEIRLTLRIRAVEKMLSCLRSIIDVETGKYERKN